MACIQCFVSPILTFEPNEKCSTYQLVDVLPHELESDAYTEANNLRFELDKHHQGI